MQVSVPINNPKQSDMLKIVPIILNPPRRLRHKGRQIDRNFESVVLICLKDANRMAQSSLIWAYSICPDLSVQILYEYNGNVILSLYISDQSRVYTGILSCTYINFISHFIRYHNTERWCYYVYTTILNNPV